MEQTRYFPEVRLNHIHLDWNRFLKAKMDKNVPFSVNIRNENGQNEFQSAVEGFNRIRLYHVKSWRMCAMSHGSELHDTDSFQPVLVLHRDTAPKSWGRWENSDEAYKAKSRRNKSGSDTTNFLFNEISIFQTRSW